jgi:hypothetical protein
MRWRWLWHAVLLLAAIAPGRAQDAPPRPDPVADAVRALEAAITNHQPSGLDALLDPAVSADDRTLLTLTLFGDDVTGAAVRERSREPIAGGARVLAEILVDRRGSGAITTWQIGLITPNDAPARISLVKQVAAVSGLRRLELDTTRQFAVKDFTFTATDFRLTMRDGVAFAANVEEGATALVLRGKGRMEFAPADPVERHQLVRFNKKPSVDEEIDQAFIRLSPIEFDTRIASGSLVPATRDEGDAKRADSIFEAWAPRSFNIELGDLSSDRWSFLPAVGDALADMHTRHFGWLSYARSGTQNEDVTLFDRIKRKNISIYASDAKLATRGRFYTEDTERVFDVEHYEVSTRFVNPDKGQISGIASMRVKLLRHDVGTISVKLDAGLAVSQVTADRFGRLLHLRLAGQDGLLISFPDLQPAGAEITLHFTYAGRLQAQSLSREAASVARTEAGAQSGTVTQENAILPEPNFAYTVGTYWYPQGPVSDYATARLSVTTPEDYRAVATGTPAGDAVTGGERTAVFVAEVPARYLSVVVSRMVPVPGASVTTANGTVSIMGWSNPRQIGPVRTLSQRAADMIAFYAELAGGVPYPSFGVLALEADRPGGHSPAYFAAINQPTPTTIFSWRNDPIAFDDQFPNFYLAHEIAHQWWGQSVGTKNYHEQWLSEGLAQYFAYLYAGKDRGPRVQQQIMTRMKASVREFDDSGPITLGYRLGHVVGDGTNYRAIVYNKSVVVLDLLRQFIGDDAFFAGLRRFYREHRDDKAGTDDLRAAFEAEAHEPLGRFFDAWIMGSDRPALTFSSVVEANGATAWLRIEQAAPLFDLPVRVEIDYEDRPTETVTVRVRGAVTEQRVPLAGRVKKGGIRMLPVM